jgi:hypothetical protein
MRLSLFILGIFFTGEDAWTDDPHNPLRADHDLERAK